MTKAKESFSWVESPEDKEFLTEFAFMCMLCFDVYMRKHIIEKIIDHSLSETNNSVKNDKINSKNKDTTKKQDANKD